jgi:hypothetical protein
MLRLRSDFHIPAKLGAVDAADADRESRKPIARNNLMGFNA